MAIRCPYCEHPMELTGIKPGRFHPRCTNCKEKFELVIADDPAASPRVKRIVAPNLAATQAPAASVTAPPKQNSPRNPADTSAGQRAVPKKDDRDSRAQVTSVSPNVAGGSPQVTSVSPQLDRSLYFTQVKPDLKYDDLHGRLGGYDILQKLGQGGMGSVYLARQVSLDRNVAVKTLSPTLAEDPQFVARFTREAYAAAQLNHHNVVQIHDIGQDKGTNFFSMELVDGTTLASVVEREGRLDPINAVTYILQAARGLKFAHDHGLIHRDVKPDNLLLNKEGVVKVADLGLVKRAGAANDLTLAQGIGTPEGAAPGATQLNSSMGTPAYMSPEQVRDAGKVDHRADIYSLGCTLYDLVTGRPPFSGKTAMEVMTKHQKEPITPPEKIVTNLPKRLSEIIQKMTAKTPEARYQSMTQVVKDLEDFLGIEHGGNIRGSQDHISIVTFAVEKFNSSSFAGLRRNLLLAFLVVVLLGLGIGIATVTPWLIGGSLAVGIVTPLAYQLTVGVRQKTTLFVRARQWLLSLRLSDYLTALGAAIVALLALYLLGQLGLWIGVAAAAIGLGILFHFGVDQVVAAERESPLLEVERLIREMRVKGVDEDGIRGFIAKFSGNRWEEFYEALFGYDEKMKARRLYGKGERGKDRKRYAIWRDWIIARIDRRLEERKLDRERALLAKIEKKAFEAKGLQANAAARQGNLAAGAVVTGARNIRKQSESMRLSETLAPTAAPSFTKLDWIDSEAPHASESLEGWERQGYLRRRFGGPLDILLGRRFRFLLAAIILLGAAKWVQINGVEAVGGEFSNITKSIAQTPQEIKDKINTAIDKGAIPKPGTNAPTTQEAAGLKPLQIKGVPQSICDAVGSWNGVLAGVLLLLSVVIYGHAMSVGVILGAAVILFANRYSLPVIGEIRQWMSAAAGGVIALGAMLFLRESED